MALHVYHDHHQDMRIIEQCHVSPPPCSVPSPSHIPLSFLDLPWVYSVPVQSIFFYNFPHSTNHFLQKVLPNLKHSLPLTLHHFFPFAANLVFPPQPHHPHILYSSGDSINFTVAESTRNLHHLISDTLRDVRDLYPFVPTLPPLQTLQDGTRLFPLMAIQVTVLPNSGFSICLTFRHIAADAKSFIHFMKFWASVCWSCTTTGGTLPPPPLLDRDIIEDPKGIKLLYLKELWNSSEKGVVQFKDPVHNFLSDKVRVTFIFSRDHVEKLKKWVHVKCKSLGLESKSLHISSFVVMCSLVWVCLVKSEEVKSEGTNGFSVPSCNNDEIYNLTFLAYCRNPRDLSIPSTDFGNCLVRRIVSLEKSKLVGENGVVEAVIAIGSKVRDVQYGALNGVENFAEENKILEKSTNHVVKIGGSPKLGVYDTDFGFGKPIKSEILHIEYSGSISLSDCRHNEGGGAEAGLVLDLTQANKFNIILKGYLDKIATLE